MFTGVYHIGYLTDDMAAAIDFYRRTFGAELKLETLSGDGVSKMAFVRIGQTEIELMEPGDKARLNGRTGLILDHVGYTVESIEADMARLSSKGVGFESAAPRTNPEGARLIYLDSATTLGARIHITEPPRG